MRLTLDYYFLENLEEIIVKKKIDGRSKEMRLLKAKKERKNIFSQIKKCCVQIGKQDFEKILKGATSYYFLKSQYSDIPFYEITRTGFINHIRHRYTNYESYLDVLRLLETIPFTYRLKLGYLIEIKVYNWLKRKFNRTIEKQCQKVLSEFDEWTIEKGLKTERKDFHL